MQVGARFLAPVAAVARPSPAAAADGVTRHLVLGLRPGWQDPRDYEAIAEHVHELEPSIRVFIVRTTERNSTTRRMLARLPTFLFSPGRMSAFRLLRGKVYQGWPLEKFEEVRRLKLARVPVPRTAILTPQLRLDPAEWGPFVILKPTDIATSSHGRGINLMRTERVSYRPPGDYPPDHPGRLGPMIVQQYINTGDKLTTYRVLTLFGEPLYARLNIGGPRHFDLNAPDEAIESANVALQAADARESPLIDDPDILALARQAHDALPEIPLKGCDILRDVDTGGLYVIELNSGGNTWHFSSNFGRTLRKVYGPEYELLMRQQFDAMRTAAKVLIRRTLAEAE
ncbi:MAG TPA: hypothetical protein VFB16_06765 [Bauldia sp.]|nr:hypothetical protein [Bauldia sp.]